MDNPPKSGLEKVWEGWQNFWQFTQNQFTDGNLKRSAVDWRKPRITAAHLLGPDSSNGSEINGLHFVQMVGTSSGVLTPCGLRSLQSWFDNFFWNSVSKRRKNWSNAVTSEVSRYIADVHREWETMLPPFLANKQRMGPTKCFLAIPVNLDWTFDTVWVRDTSQELKT